MAFEAWIPFIFSALLLLAAPGPTILAIVAASASAGARGGVAVACGSLCAVLVITVLITSGLYARLLALPSAADVLHWAGGAFVAWLGIKLITRGSTGVRKAIPTRSDSLLLQGFTTTLLNPKIALAYPSMIAAYANGTDGAAAPMASIFTLCAAMVYGAVALITAATAANNLFTTRTARVLRVAAGIVMIGLAIRIVWPSIAGFL